MILIVRLLAVFFLGISFALRQLTEFLLRIAPDVFAPVIEWPKPDGNFPVGTQEMEICNHPTDNAQRLMARLWYPAQSIEGCARRAYFGPPAELNAMSRGLEGLLTKVLMRRLGQIKTWSYEKAEIVGGQPLSVILFSHGFTGYVGQNTHLCEHLASHGYLVVAIAHPHGASIVRYPDGAVTRQTAAMVKRLITPRYLIDMMSLRKALPRQDRLDLLRRIACSPLSDEDGRWAGNISAAISCLSSMEAPPEIAPVMAMADWNRVGLVGMSLGGSASVTAANRDLRAHAAVNLDGMQQGDSLLDTPSRVPVLVLHGQQALSADGMTCTQYYYESPEVGSENAEIQRWLVHGANHFDFTDMTAFGRGPVRKMLHLGQIDGMAMLAATAACVRDFLDMYLRGRQQKGEQPLTSQYSFMSMVEGRST